MTTHLLAIGACSIDTILTVPHYPQEDAKLRATSSSRRRGGNVANTLEVLQQLLQIDGDTRVQLDLVATLPAIASKDNEIIRNSFRYPPRATPSMLSIGSITAVPSVSVNLDRCLYREDCNEAVASYIIASEPTGSRTIVNHNPFVNTDLSMEMTFEEFVPIADSVLSPSRRLSKDVDAAKDALWFHFEGRIPDVTLNCIEYLREHSGFTNAGGPDVKISVELEKPGRKGLQALALRADVVFYSRSWAEGEGYISAAACLREQGIMLCNHSNKFQNQPPNCQLLVCTWGASGASATIIGTTSEFSSKTLQQAMYVEHSSAYIAPGIPIVDATGAGDTFIAGVLFGIIRKGNFGDGDGSWPLKHTLDFANELAGRKILQNGFQVQGISFEPG